LRAELHTVNEDGTTDRISREMWQATMRLVCPFVIDLQRHEELGENAVTLSWVRVAEDDTTVR
jgi:hypothetical protein